MPGHHGRYFYADNASGFIRSFRYAGQTVPTGDATTHTALAQPGIDTFGEDSEGEIVFCSLTRGMCWRIVPRP
jgi:hypothetical protein